MIEERARVIRSEGDYAWVETQRRSSCGSCAAKRGCGTGALSQVFAGRTQQMQVRNPIDAKAGDEVVLGIEEGALIKGSLAVYLIPLLTMMAGGLLGQAVAPQWLLEPEAMSMLLGILGLVVGLWWLRGFNRRASQNPLYMAEILRVHQDDSRVDISNLSGKASR